LTEKYGVDAEELAEFEEQTRIVPEQEFVFQPKPERCE
jgi:hypothetical protein